MHNNSEYRINRLIFLTIPQRHIERQIIILVINTHLYARTSFDKYDFAIAVNFASQLLAQ